MPNHAFAICTTSDTFAAVFLNTEKAIATEQIHSNVRRLLPSVNQCLPGTFAKKQYL